MRYAVLWDRGSKTLTITKEDAKSDSDATKTSNSVGTVVYGEFGEVPESTSHPQIDQHLDNMAMSLGVDRREITVKNETGNDRLDKFEREGRPSEDLDLSMTADEDTQVRAEEVATLDPSVTITAEDTEGKGTPEEQAAADKARAEEAADEHPEGTDNADTDTAEKPRRGARKAATADA